VTIWHCDNCLSLPQATTSGSAGLQNHFRFSGN
jgi:hypothetical protein